MTMTLALTSLFILTEDYLRQAQLNLFGCSFKSKINLLIILKLKLKINILIKCCSLLSGADTEHFVQMVWNF